MIAGILCSYGVLARGDARPVHVHNVTCLESLDVRCELADHELLPGLHDNCRPNRLDVRVVVERVSISVVVAILGPTEF